MTTNLIAQSTPTTEPSYIPVLIVEVPVAEDKKPSVWETVELKADQLIDEIEKVVAEGNARRIVVKHDGEVIVDFPLTLGVLGTVVAAPLAGIAAIAALITDCTLEVERDVPSPETPS